MALRKAWTDPYGVEHPASYWRITEFSVHLGLGVFSFTLHPWASAAARTAGADPLPHPKRFRLTNGTLTDAMNSAPEGATLYDAIAGVLYDHATTETAEGDSEVFFDDATDV